MSDNQPLSGLPAGNLPVPPAGSDDLAASEDCPESAEALAALEAARP